MYYYSCTESADLFYKMYDSEMVKESMKNKMRNILMKYKNGILCDNFMDIYAVSIRSIKEIFNEQLFSCDFNQICKH